MKKIFLFLAVIALAGIVHAQGMEPFLEIANVLFCKTSTQELVIAVNAENPSNNPADAFQGKVTLEIANSEIPLQASETREIAIGGNWILFGYNATTLRNLDGEYMVNAVLYNETEGTTLEQTFSLNITNNCSGLSISRADISNPAYNDSDASADVTIKNSSASLENVKVRFDITDSAGKQVVSGNITDGTAGTTIYARQSQTFSLSSSVIGVPEGIYTANITLYSVDSANKETVVARQSQKIAITNPLQKLQNVPETNSFGIMIVLFGVLSLFAISRKQEKA